MARLYFNIINLVQLFCLIVFIFVSYFVYSIIQKPINKVDYNRKPLSKKLLVDKTKDYDIYILNSVFNSFDKQDKPYKIHSKKAIKLKDNLYMLEDIEGYYNYRDDKPVLLSAKSGKMDEKSKIVKFYRSIKLTYEDCLITTDQIDVNLIDSSAIGSQGVIIKYKDDSEIKANQFNIKSKERILHLHGNVQTHIKNPSTSKFIADN